MKRLPFAFMIAGVIFILAGMAYGLDMAARQDFTTAPAHGHLNLLGFVLNSVFAFYYHLVPAAQRGQAGWVHFWLHQAGVVAMFPGIILSNTGGGDTLALIGSLLVLAAMLLFAFIVVTSRERTA